MTLPDNKGKDGLLLIVERAKKGYYHDFESPIAMPKFQLVQDLRAVGLYDTADEVIKGKYDE